MIIVIERIGMTMINKKILSVLTTITLLSGMCVGLTNVSAAPTESEPFSFEYVETNDNTTKNINVYYTGEALNECGVINGEIYVTFDINTVSNAKFTLNTVTTDSKWDGNPESNDTYLSEGWNFLISAAEAVFPTDRMIGTITLTVPEDTDSFNMTIDIDQSYLGGGDMEMYQSTNPIVVSIPKYTTGGGSTEVDAGEGQDFITYDDPHVKVFTADLAGTDHEGKTIKWVLTNTSGKLSEPISATTDFTGGLDVKLGLKIVGDISEIASAKLVIE